MTINGVSTCTEAGTEKYEQFQIGIGRHKRTLVQYDYRHTELDGIFDDAEAWGVDTLKGWIEDYESSRFTAIDTHTAVITSEYNMECVKAWLERNTPIAERKEF